MQTSLRKVATLRRRIAPRHNERRLTTQHPRRRALGLAAGAAALPTLSHVAGAQAYPSRPVRIIIGLAAGNVNDIIARLIGQRLSTKSVACTSHSRKL